MAWMIVLQKMVMLVMLMLVGFGCAKAGWTDGDFSQKASRLVMNIFIVATIINSVSNAEPILTNQELVVAVGAVFVIFVLGGVLGWFGSTAFGLKGKELDVAWLSIFFMNNVFIGFPVVEPIFGANAIFCASLSNLPFNLLLYSLGTARLRSGERQGQFKLRDVFSPPMVATLIAIVIFLFRLPVPDLVVDTMSTLGAATVPLSMIIVGTSLSQVPIREAFLDWRAYAVTLVRLVICPILTWLLLGAILPESMSLVKSVFVVISACPSAAMITILCVRFQRDDALASKINFLSTILCAVTLPLMTYFLL